MEFSLLLGWVYYSRRMAKLKQMVNFSSNCGKIAGKIAVYLLMNSRGCITKSESFSWAYLGFTLQLGFVVRFSCAIALLLLTGVMEAKAEGLTQEQTATVATANPSPQKLPVLKRGSRGQKVAELQIRLRELGYFNHTNLGYYGPVTQRAVRKFQRDQGLKVDGIVGQKTHDALRFIPSQKTETVAPTPSPKLTETLPKPELKSSNINLDHNIKNSFKTAIAFLQNPTFVEVPPRDPSGKMTHVKTINGAISPKSIVHSGTGLFFAQNMMYRHTITVYNRNFDLVETIPDQIKLSDFGLSKFPGNHKGSPVETSFSPNGQYAYIANYKMYGSGFSRPGTDKCSPSGKHDNSFLYKINTATFKIDQVIQVGSVPKFNTVTPNGRFVLVSNWCSWDLSIVDTQTDTEIKRIKIGRYPRGIAVDPTSEFAYVAVMGSTKIARINLNDFSLTWLNNVGRSPRHLNIDPQGKFLYTTLNSEGTVAKINLETGKVIKKITTGKAPRSMTISDDGEFLYVVNYSSNTMSKVRTQDMRVIHSIRTNHHPIGITYDPQKRQIWVACYSGSVMVFQD